MVLKNKKQCEIFHNRSVGVGEDKISKLPDQLIHHILSFLPIKCAMSTCILSKRWNYVSNSIPTLDFREWWGTDVTIEEERLNTQVFMNFLDTVLYHHEKPNIKKFYLLWDHHFDESRVKKWISIVIKGKVEELLLSGGSKASFLFPLSLFSCDSLTVLDLDKITLNVPNTVSFPRLKLLRLRSMERVNGISIERVVSNSPILEELSLIQCDGPFLFKSEVLCISNFALKNLYIRACDFSEYTMKICAPNLSNFSYGYEVPVDFVIDSFPSLIEAEIDIRSDEEYSVGTLFKLFEKLSNVKLLKLHGESFTALSEFMDTLSTDLPALNNLIHLEVSPTWILTILGVRRTFSFLQLLPNLELVVFSRNIGLTTDDWLSLDPERPPLRIKSIKFMGVGAGGTLEHLELNAIKLFLKYAVFLETVTIVASPWLSKDYEVQTKIMKLLLMFPKPANCVVKFLMSSEDT